MKQITHGTFAVFSFDQLRDFSPEASNDNCVAGINSAEQPVLLDRNGSHGTQRQLDMSKTSRPGRGRAALSRRPGDRLVSNIAH
jgi:hypothetical protein